MSSKNRIDSAALWAWLVRRGTIYRAPTVIALSTLLLVAIHPLTFGSLTSTDDGLLHLYRLVGLDHALRHGDLWPRFVPGLAYGYGLPLFNFYSPLSLYPFEFLHLLGLPFVDAMLIGLIAYT